jgi:hypothetical protein
MNKHETEASSPVRVDQQSDELQEFSSSKDKAVEQQEGSNKSKTHWVKVKDSVPSMQKPNKMPSVHSKKPPTTLAVRMFITK